MVDPDARNSVGQAVAQAAIAPQPDLLDTVGLEFTQRVDEVRQRRAKAGRPPGARNKRQEEAARYVVETLGDPLLSVAAIAVMPAAELAAALGCSLIEAVTEKRLAAQVVLPYLHSRKPLAVDVTNRRLVTLVIQDGPGSTGDDQDLTIVGVVENQTFSNEGPDDV